MSMTILSKIFISEGRGHPVSLKVQIDGCSDHGSNNDMLAAIWKDTLRKTRTTSETCHYEVETTTEIVNESDYYFVIGERLKLPNEVAVYQQDLYAIRAKGGTSNSLGTIQHNLFSSNLFEGSEVNQNSIILPTNHAKKVINLFIIGNNKGNTRQRSHDEEHYHRGSYFRICRQDEVLDDFVAPPVSHDVAVPCNDIHEGCYLAEMRHVGKPLVPVMPPAIRPTKSVNPNAYVSPPNANSMPRLTKENGHETPEDVVDHKNDANAFEEKGSHSVSVDTTPKGDLFSSANTGIHDDERVVMTPVKDANGYATAARSKEESVTVGKFSQEVTPSSNYYSQGPSSNVHSSQLSQCSIATQSSDGSSLSHSLVTPQSFCYPQSQEFSSLSDHTSSADDNQGPGFNFDIQAAPMGLSVQATGHNSGMPRESTTVAEEEVFQQDVPPTPNEHKQLHYTTGNSNQGKTIDDCVQDSMDVEPVEQNNCESVPLVGKFSEAGMDMPVRTQQQCLDNKEEALVIPTLHPSHKPALELDNVKRRLYGVTPQQGKQPPSMLPGVTQQPTNSNCYSPDNRPVQASQQQQQLRSQSIWPGRHPTQQHYQQQHYQQQYYPYNNGIASVPNPLGQPSARHGHFARERTTTGPNACRPTQTTAFSRNHLMAFYPLSKGKVIYSAPRTRFREQTIIPYQQFEDNNCEIGSGGNGSVFLFKFSGECFAIKKTEIRTNELNWWSQFDHPNVIPLLAVAIAEYYSNFPNKSTCWQVMPQMEGDLSLLVDYGSLESIRDKKPEDSWLLAFSNAKHILKKTLCGLEYLHRVGVVHRDIKERNVFYKMQCEHGLPYECTCPSPGKCEVKLGDFDAMVLIQTQSNHVLGTKNYRSPEMLTKENISSTVDIYAFGCMVMKLVDGRKQYKTEYEGISRVVQGSDFHQQQYLQEILNMRVKYENILTSKYDEISAFGKFIKDCIKSTPDERPSAATLLKDPFFK